MASKCNNFLPALYRMCNNDDDHHRQCITWAADGGSFWVSNIEQFARDILPVYYKHNNYASFVRQLNMYGFHRSTEPKGKVEPGVQMIEHFTHDNFKRGHEHLLKNIHRKTSKMAGKKRAKESDHTAEFKAREAVVTQMQEDIEILKKNQMQLASTVQGLHQSFIALQIDSQQQKEMLRKLQLELGVQAVKPEVTPVGGYYGGLFDRRRAEEPLASPEQEQAPQTSQVSLIDLATLGDDDDDNMNQDMDDIQDVLGQMDGAASLNGHNYLFPSGYGY